MNSFYFKIASLTDVITNSSSEVFTIYDKNGIDKIKNMVDAILDIASNGNAKYHFDDIFEISLNYDIDDIKEKYEDEESNFHYLFESNYPNIDFSEATNDMLLNIAEKCDSENYEGYPIINGFTITPKENSEIDKKLLERACTLISSINSWWNQYATYC